MKSFLSVICPKRVKINLQCHFILVATENQLICKYFLGSSCMFLLLIRRPALFLLFPDAHTFLETSNTGDDLGKIFCIFTCSKKADFWTQLKTEMTLFFCDFFSVQLY